MSKTEPFLISVIDLNIDVKPIVDDCIRIVDEFKKLEADKKDLTKPYSIVLTENPGVDETAGELVSYSDIHNKSYFDRNNEAHLKDIYRNTGLSQLVSKLPFPFSIMRLSVLPPNTIISMHTDASCHAQLAIITNEDCFVAARSGETKHVPVDAKLYIISTTLPHTAFNASAEERIHLSISIYDKDYVKMLKGEDFSAK
jgi:hypothetical protein